MKDFKQLTPRLKARGLWSVREPFLVNEKVEYTCIAIRSFYDFYNDGIDPLVHVYEPVGIKEGTDVAGTPFVLKQEELKGINIISIQAPNGVVIHIPDNFILSYPDSSVIQYEHVVATVSLGILPNGLDVTLATDAIADAVKNAFGVTPDIRLARAPSNESPTYEEHLMLELARKNAKKINETSDSQIAELTAKNKLLQQTVDAMKQILIDNNIMPS